MRLALKPVFKTLIASSFFFLLPARLSFTKKKEKRIKNGQMISAEIDRSFFFLFF